MEDHRTLAKSIFTATRVTTEEAWTQAFNRMSSASKKSGQHLGDQLRDVLSRFKAHRICTSACECGFAKRLKVISKQQMSQLPSTEATGLKLKYDYRPEEEAEVIGLARAEWARRFGSARQGAPVRIDIGKKRPVKAGKLSLRRWIASRRQAVSRDAASHATGDYGRFRDLGEVDGWTQSHSKEVDFQREKRLKRKAEALDDGRLLQDRALMPIVKEPGATPISCFSCFSLSLARLCFY